MNTTYTTNTPKARAIIKAAFGVTIPKGRLQVTLFTPQTLTSYWSGGSRDHWATVGLADLAVGIVAPEAGSTVTPPAQTITHLPEGWALVRYTKSERHASAIIYLNKANLTKLLPRKAPTLEDQVALIFTGSL